MNGTVSVKELSWESVLAPLVVAVIVGIGASYVTTRVQIGTIEERMKRAETDISRLRGRADINRKTQGDLRNRVIRMETKIDLLLQSQGIDSDDLNTDG